MDSNWDSGALFFGSIKHSSENLSQAIFDTFQSSKSLNRDQDSFLRTHMHREIHARVRGKKDTQKEDSFSFYLNTQHQC